MTAHPLMHNEGILLYLPWKFDLLGGVDVVVDRLWRGMESKCPGMATIGIQDWEYQGEKTDQAGRRFLHLNLPAPYGPTLRAKIRYAVTLVRRLPVVLQALKQRNIRTVNVHFPTANTFPLALLKKFRLWNGKLVLSFHGSDVNDIDPNTGIWRTIAEQADVITACSASLARRVDALGLFNQSIQVIHNGIDCQGFACQASSEPLPIHRPYILNVGNYVPRKAQDVLLQGFKRISKSYPDLHLVFVGGTDNGLWLNHLKDLSKQLGIEKKTSFFENQSQAEVARLMTDATCFIHTAHQEPFGLVVIEAAACGTPIVASRVGGIPEIIPSENFGLLFGDGDIESLVTHLQTTLKYADDAKARASRMAKHVQTHFSVEAMVRKYSRSLF